MPHLSEVTWMLSLREETGVGWSRGVRDLRSVIGGCLNWLLQLLGYQSLLICYKLRALSSEVPYLVAGIAYTCSVGDELFGFE